MVTGKPFYRPRTKYIYTEQPVNFTTAKSIVASSIHTIYTLPTDLAQPTRCHNCGHNHSQSKDSSSSPSPNCFFITIRRSGRDRLPLSTPHSIPIAIPLSPTTITTTTSSTTQAHHLREYIWTEFSSLKAEVDLDRDTLTHQRSPKSKGQLKEKAPIPWLSWSSPSGQSGQTRNKANFFAIWDRVMAEEAASTGGGGGGSGTRKDGATLWVSSVLLPPTIGAERDEPVIWSDELASELEMDPHMGMGMGLGLEENFDRYAQHHHHIHLHAANSKVTENILRPVGSGRWEAAGATTTTKVLVDRRPGLLCS